MACWGYCMCLSTKLCRDPESEINTGLGDAGHDMIGGIAIEEFFWAFAMPPINSINNNTTLFTLSENNY